MATLQPLQRVYFPFLNAVERDFGQKAAKEVGIFYRSLKRAHPTFDVVYNIQTRDFTILNSKSRRDSEDSFDQFLMDFHIVMGSIHGELSKDDLYLTLSSRQDQGDDVVYFYSIKELEELEDKEEAGEVLANIPNPPAQKRKTSGS